MKKLYFSFLLIVFVVSVQAQWNWEIGASSGLVNYIGDIGNGNKNTKKPSDVQLEKMRWNCGGFVRYRLHQRFYLRSSIEATRLEGDDKYSSDESRVYRNLSFRNDIWNLGLMAEGVIYENPDLGHRYSYRNGVRFYAFAGGNLIYSNPKAFYDGQWIDLQPLKTEGTKYSRVVMAIPMGIGVCFKVQKVHRIGIEVNYRKTNTDYLDDVSDAWGKYDRQSLAGQLSNRNPDLQDQPSGISGNYGWYDNDYDVS